MIIINYVINEVEFEIDIIIKKNNKNSYLRFKSPNIIQITTPKNNTDYILKFIKRCENHIYKQYKNQEIKTNKIHLFGIEYNIIINESNKDYIEINNEDFYIYIYKHKKSVEYLIYKLYLNKLIPIIDEFMIEAKNKLDIKFDVGISYKNVKTYFGLCQIKKKNVVFSLKLAKYELDLIRSVVYHELAHFYVANHQKKFYDLLNKVFPNYKSYNKILKSIKYNDFC